METLDAVRGRQGRTELGRTNNRQPCCSNRGESCADQLDVHSRRGDQALERRMRAGEGEETPSQENEKLQKSGGVGPRKSHL